MAALTSLDAIVRRYLLEQGRPLHFYTEALFNAATCLRELTFDTLQVVNTKLLSLNSYYAVDLPADFVDDVLVGIPAGGRIQPVPGLTTLNPMRNMDDNFQYVPYNTSSNTSYNGFGFTVGSMWFWDMNEWGEPTGRYFGASGGAKSNGYQVFRERGEIQFTDTFTSPTAILTYISSGDSADNATQIDVRAFSTINAYIIWKTSPNKNNAFSPEGQQFSNQRRLLRARLNNLDKAAIINTLRNNTRGSIKN